MQAFAATRVATPIALGVWEGPPGAERRTYERSGWTPAYRWGDASCGGTQDHDHDAASAVWIYFLSAGCGGGGFTQVDYQRYAGDVVYFSSGHEIHWNHTSGTQHQYAWNTSARYATGLRLVDASAGVHRVRLHLHDGSLRTADAQVPLQPFASDSHDPMSCHLYDYGHSLRTCSEERRAESGASGMTTSGP